MGTRYLITRLLVCGCFVLSSLALGQSNPETSDEASGRPPSTVPEFMTAFTAAHETPAFEQETLQAAENALLLAEQALLPRLSFAEELVWRDYTDLELELSLGLELPLYSSITPLERELAAVSVAARQQVLADANASARASFLIELANLAALEQAHTLVSAALRAFPEHSSRPPSADGDLPSWVPPAERDAYEQHRALSEAASWFGAQLLSGQGRLARTLAFGNAALTPPPLTDVVLFLDTEFPLLPTTEECLLGAPEAAQAHSRRLSGELDDRLQARTELSLAFNADLDYAFPAWSTRGWDAAGRDAGWAAGASHEVGLSATLALEARLTLPDGWPLAGSTSLSVRPERATQRLELAWPPLPPTPNVASDWTASLAGELSELEAELRQLRAEVLQAEADLELLTDKLLWAIVDLAPQLTPAEARSLLDLAVNRSALRLTLPGAGQRPATILEPGAELIELRVQHAFASVAAVSARTHYLSACGQF